MTAIGYKKHFYVSSIKGDATKDEDELTVKILGLHVKSGWEPTLIIIR